METVLHSKTLSDNFQVEKHTTRTSNPKRKKKFLQTTKQQSVSLEQMSKLSNVPRSMTIFNFASHWSL